MRTLHYQRLLRRLFDTILNILPDRFRRKRWIFTPAVTVIDRAMTAVVQAARESQKKRVGRYAPRNPKMFMS